MLKNKTLHLLDNKTFDNKTFHNRISLKMKYNENDDTYDIKMSSEFVKDLCDKHGDGFSLSIEDDVMSPTN